MPNLPKGEVQQVQTAVTERWKSLNQTISNRAAIAYADDFRAGLVAWGSRSSLTTSCSYDAAGLVRPGPMAVFKPTVELSDYHFEFLVLVLSLSLGEIDQKALGWAFRSDLDNRYAMKLVLVKPGAAAFGASDSLRGGEWQRRPARGQTSAAYGSRRQAVPHPGGCKRQRLQVMTQGQVVDFWSDKRLTQGGVGFSCGRAERARLSWVEVSHQYDALGKLCAYLAPNGMEGRNGNIN